MSHLSLLRESKSRHIAVYAFLLVVTASASAVLVAPNLQLGNDLVTDPQWPGQYVAEWHREAVLAATTGSAVGHVCALLAGLLVARWGMHKARRAGLITALLVGSGLGATELAVASWTATPLLRDLSGFPGTGDPLEDWIIDPSLQNHIPVLVAMALTFAVFLVAAGAGFWVAHRAMLLRFVLVTDFRREKWLHLGVSSGPTWRSWGV
ncbi:hypothetical protein ETD86_51565 [Nonomuraea turkmeniaca]|uniref:Uncharacterized protein n=1 Tax=Nonomuraea turkmeniaca TaxID=103838 RepID=A0A5S4FF75_9ACTN|nr:hypothetical protein [Nonomuraea turkmeniaca]TMR07571.1 hypothetical protein ETD86_51565 [Nonomuraea turkmeniaca]